MSTFYLEYTDTSGLNIYALLFKAHNGVSIALKYNTDVLFNYFSDPVETSGFAIPLTEVGARPGIYFSPDVMLASSDSVFDRGFEYKVEFWEQLGSDPDVRDDLLKAYGYNVWNGESHANHMESYRLDDLPYYGNYYYDSDIYISTYIFNPFGRIVAGYSFDDVFQYQITNPINQVVATGLLTDGVNGILYATVKASGTNFTNGVYTLEVSGIYHDIGLLERTKFSVVPSGSVSTTSVDILTQLGYVTGYIDTGSATTTSFATTLPSTTNDHYNGQILRFTTGPLIGQGRIISDYVGASRTPILNKALLSAPSSGDAFVVFPIGGELNV